MPEKREDVEATLQQDTAPDISQQKRKWRAIDWIAGGTFIAEVLWGSWWLVTQVFHWCSWNPHVSTEHFAQFYCGVGLGILSVGYLTLILWPIIFNIFKQGKDSKQDNDPRWFHARILSSGIVGGSYAFLLPVVMSLPEGNVNSGGAAALRQAILLATGGLIALIALGETRRKNDNDREAAENLRIHQEKILKQQKEQFEKQIEKQQEQFEANAFKERKAERRERYTKGIEQLGNEKSSIRMGGVYTLAGLIDEWLGEEALSRSDRLQEGQIIINNLCAYIRNPYKSGLYLYDPEYKEKILNEAKENKNILEDTSKEAYWQETSIRLAILDEFRKGFNKNRDKELSWSDFQLNLSHSKYTHEFNLDEIKYNGDLTLLDVMVYESMTIRNVEILGKLYLDAVNIYGSLDTTGVIATEGTYIGSVKATGGDMKLG